MRLVVSLMCLGLLSAPVMARAQQSPTLAPPPSDYAQTEPTYAPAPSQGPATSASERAARYSQFSSGEGGLLLIFTELFSGAVTGGLYGHTLGKTNGAYEGVVIGGLTLGTAAAVYQYYVPVERNESLLAAGGAALGFIAGFGYGTVQGLDDQSRAVATLLATQLGIIGVLAATGPFAGDVSDGDTALVGMSALYGFVLTGLVQSTLTLANEQQGVNLTPALLAPLVGMGVGGLLAVPFELSTGRISKLTAIPLGVGAVLLLVGTALADGPIVPLSALAGVTASFVITLLATAEPVTEYPPSRTEPGLRSTSWRAVPVPVFMRSGAHNESMTAGPGMLMRF